MNDKQRERFLPASVLLRTEAAQRILDDPSLLADKLGLLSDPESPSEGEAVRERLRAKELIDTAQQERETQREKAGVGSLRGPPYVTDPRFFWQQMDKMDAEVERELRPHFPWDVKNAHLIDPTRLRYLESKGEYRISGRAGAYMHQNTDVPFVSWAGGRESQLPYVSEPGNPLLYEKIGDNPDAAAHEYRHFLYEQGIPSLLPGGGVLYGLKAAERGLKKARLGNAENYILLRQILSSQNNADLLNNLDTFAWYMNDEGYKDWRSPHDPGRSRLQRKDDFEEIFTKISQAKKEDDREALAELVPELLGKFNLPLSVDEWDKRDDRVILSPLVSSYLKPPARYEPYKPTWFDKLIERHQQSPEDRQKIIKQFQDPVEMPEDFRAGGRVRLI